MVANSKKLRNTRFLPTLVILIGIFMPAAALGAFVMGGFAPHFLILGWFFLLPIFFWFAVALAALVLAWWLINRTALPACIAAIALCLCTANICLIIVWRLIRTVESL